MISTQALMDYEAAALSWIGQVPEHREFRRVKFLFRERSQEFETIATGDVSDYVD